MTAIINAGSFRDPSGFIFNKNGILFRQINKCYSRDFDLLQQSGLLRLLQEQRLLVKHHEVDLVKNAVLPNAWRVICPETIPFISYPYEWSFSQIKDAALLTLEIQQNALAHGMILKDASAFNVQFLRGKPIFIDTLSFEWYCDGKPWQAYGQFCRHFLAPLALMCYMDIGLGQLLRVHIDGIPLLLASRLLPFSTNINFGLFIHLHMHAKAQKSNKNLSTKGNKHGLHAQNTSWISRNGLLGIIESLINTINKLSWNPIGTEWANYYSNTNYTKRAFEDKVNVINKIVQFKKPKRVWDIGSNDGTFSRIAALTGAQVCSFDIDPGAVERNYRLCKAADETGILPLLLDLANPSPGLGWANTERSSLLQRGPTDMVFALAVVHHLAIGNNLPMKMIATYFKRICRWLIIEFIPKSDSQVIKMLSTRQDIFTEYTEDGFLAAFQDSFTVTSRIPLIESERVIFVMEKKG